MPAPFRKDAPQVDCRATRHGRKKYRRKNIVMKCLLLAAIIMIGLPVGDHLIKSHLEEQPKVNPESRVESQSKMEDQYPQNKSANKDKKLSVSEMLHTIQSDSVYPKAMVEFAEKYEKTIDYVYHYPEYKDKTWNIDLSAEAASKTVPLLIQWDPRWGYTPYGDGLIGYTGCGPTSLSMVAIHLLGDATWTPLKVAQFATENGYCVPGNGSSWTLISKGSQSLGLHAKELPTVESTMKKELDKNHPIIAVVGPGDFTYSGHFMVITGYDKSGFTINDPNSRENSAKTWDYNTLSGQIRNLWAMSKD